MGNFPKYNLTEPASQGVNNTNPN